MTVIALALMILMIIGLTYTAVEDASLAGVLGWTLALGFFTAYITKL